MLFKILQYCMYFMLKKESPHQLSNMLMSTLLSVLTRVRDIWDSAYKGSSRCFGTEPICSIHISLYTVLQTILATAGKQTKAGADAIYISAEGEDRSTNGRWGRDKGHWHDFIEREYLVHLCLDDSGGKCQFASRIKEIRNKRNEEKNAAGGGGKLKGMWCRFSLDFPPIS